MEKRLRDLEDAKNDHTTRIIILEMVTHDAKSGIASLSGKQDEMKAMLADHMKTSTSKREKVANSLIGSLFVLVLSLVSYIFLNHAG